MRKSIIFLPLLAISIAGVSIGKTKESITVLSADETVDNVKIGDVFEVEPRILEYEGQSKTVNGQIILPDGTSKEGKQFTISMPGVYTVNYRAFFGTHEVSYSKLYHCHRTSADFIISSESSNKPQVGEYSHPLKSGEIKGAKLILDSKTTFTYEREIDFSTYNSNESFVDVIVDTSQSGTSDLETFTIRLTDVDNNNNYVDITVTDSGPIDDDGRGCYVLAGSNNQFKTGYEGSRLHTSKYGTNVGMSFRNLPEKSANVAKFYLDYAEKTFYVSPILNFPGVKTKITDLDDKTIYGSNIWEGFTSHKAKLSIFANSLSNSSATLIVSKIANIDLSPLDFVDETAPTINIDYDGQDKNNLPKASVNKPYKIFNANITDNFDTDLSYTTYVTYYDTVNNKRKDISIKNNTFTPKEEGTYKITYEAKDHSCNVAKKDINITTINDPQTMSLSLDTSSISKELYSKINLPSIDDVIVTGGSGHASITRKLFDENNNEIVIEGDTFIPDSIGTYKVNYDATDYIGNTAKTVLNIEVTDPGHPVFVGEVNLPRILIKGHKYTLPAYPGAEVVNKETVSLASKVFVNGVALSSNSFTASDSCVVKYELNGNTGTQTFEQSIDVVESGSPFNFANYFHGDFAKEVNADDVKLTASSGNPHDLFASVLPYDNLFVKFSIDPNNVNFDKLVFKFSDSLDPDNSLTFKMNFSEENAYISLANDSTEYLFGKTDSETEQEYLIDFFSSNGVLKDILHNEIAVAKFNDQGKLFSGFKGGVYLDIMMENVVSSSSVKILTISNQVLGHGNDPDYKDFIKPIIIIEGTFKTEQSYNVNAYIPTASVFDVLSDSSITMTVSSPSGTYKLKDVDATVEHTFKLDEIGTYNVVYTGVDSTGITATLRRSISVYDFTAPVLNITGSVNESYRLNDAITIPSYTVSDDSNEYTLDIFLMMPDNQQRLLLIDKNGSVTSYLDEDSMIYNSSFKVNSTTFKAEQFGNYTLRYVAYDFDFNKTVQELHFVVK